MRKWYSLLVILILVCMVGTAVFLVLAPDQVPVHYDFSGNVNRIGSKFENLLYPVVTAAMGAFFVILARKEKAKGELSNEKVLLISGFFILVFQTVTAFFSMGRALLYDTGSMASVSDDLINRIVFISLGALLIVLGNIMPKARRNSLFGLRTQWSLSNDEVWAKSQRFGGIASVIAGFVLILVTVLVRPAWYLFVLGAFFLLWIIACIAATYVYYRKERDRQ